MSPPSASEDWRTAAESLGVVRRLLTRQPGLLLAAHRLTLARKFPEAEAAYRELLRVAPDHRVGLLNLVNLLLTRGKQHAAVEFRTRLIETEVDALRLDPEDRAKVLEFRLAAARIGPPPERVPAAFVAKSFDLLAGTYDERADRDLRYRGPQVVFEAVLKVLGQDARGLDILDLGCGTGLCAPIFRTVARSLDGIDLSPRMLEKARAKGLYGCLELGDVGASPALKRGTHDLVLAVDVLSAMGDLAPVMHSAAGTLRPGGRFAFTTDPGASGDYTLMSSGRFAHSPQYVRDVATAAGFAVESSQDAVMKFENRRDVVATVFILQLTGEVSRD